MAKICNKGQDEKGKAQKGLTSFEVRINNNLKGRMLKEMSERTRSSKEGRISRAGNDVYSTAEGSGGGVVGRGGE